MRLFRRGVIPIEDSVPAPTEREILRALGVPHHDRVAQVDEEGVRRAIALALRRALRMTTYKAVFRSEEVTHSGPDKLVLNDVELRSPALAQRFEGAKHVAIIGVTLGQVWDDVLDDLASRQEAAEAWFLDAIGNHLVDRASRRVEERITQDMARAGLSRMGRYRPGYGDVPLEMQKVFCDFVQTSRIGVTPNEAMSLWPRKSVTTIVGFCENKSEEESSSIVNSQQTS